MNRRHAVAAILLYMAAAHVLAEPVALRPVSIEMLAKSDKAFQEQSQAWFPVLQGAAWSLLWKLAAIDFAWAGIGWVLERKEIGEIFVGVTRKMLVYGFFGMLIQWGELVPIILSSFAQIGQKASNVGTITPDVILGYGLAAWAQITMASKQLGFFSQLALALPLEILGLMIALCFAVVAGQLFVTLVESYIVAGAGIIMLGFGGSRWTADMASAYPKYAVAVGVKLLMCYLIVGIGVNIFGDYVLDPQDITATGRDLFVQVLVFAFIAWSIPSFAASMVSGSASSTLGGFLGAVSTALVAGGAVGGALKSASSGAVSSLREAAGNGGDTRDALSGGPGSISGSPASGGSGGSIAGAGQSGVGPSFSQPPGGSATPTLPSAAREAQSSRQDGAASSASTGSGSSQSASTSSTGSSPGGSGPGGGSLAASARGAAAATADVAGGKTDSRSPGMTGTGGGNASRESVPNWASPDSRAAVGEAGGGESASTDSLASAAGGSTDGGASSVAPENSTATAADTGSPDPATVAQQAVASQGDASNASVGGDDTSGGRDKKDDGDKSGRPRESLTDKVARARQNLVHQDGANVQVGGISMGHTKD